MKKQSKSAPSRTRKSAASNRRGVTGRGVSTSAPAWVTASGQQIPVPQLTNNHLINIQRRLLQNVSLGQDSAKKLRPIQQEVRRRGLA